MKKVIIIGANLGGLTSAVLLGRAGWDVTLFEQKDRTGIGSPWVENMDLAVFDRLELDPPPADCYRKKKTWAFLPPAEGLYAVAYGPEESREVLIDRQKLTDYLLSLAEATGTVCFSKTVTELVVDSGHVSGVRVDGAFTPADLTIDCTGPFSELRQQLPKFYGIAPAPDESSMLRMVRSFYEWGDGAPMPKYTNKMYLRQGEKPLIAWCVSDVRDYCADVMVAKKGAVTEEDISETVDALRPENPIIGAPADRATADAYTPMQQDLSKRVVPGYVILGSTPSMTVPLLTPPLSDTMDAARILAEVLAVNDSCETDDLYVWQVRYFRDYVAKEAAAEVFLNWLFEADPEDLDFLFEAEIIDGDFLSDLMNGHQPSIVSKGRGFFGMGVKKPATVNLLRSVLADMAAAYDVVADIPDTYNKTTFKKWQADVERLFS